MAGMSLSDYLLAEIKEIAEFFWRRHGHDSSTPPTPSEAMTFEGSTH